MKITENGPWFAGSEKDKNGREVVYIQSDDFTHDVRLYLDVTGDFATRNDKMAYAEMIAKNLNSLPPLSVTVAE